MLYQWDKSSLIYNQTASIENWNFTVDTSPYSYIYFYTADDIVFDNTNGLYQMTSYSMMRDDDVKDYNSFQGVFGYSTSLVADNKLSKIYYPQQRESLHVDFSVIPRQPPSSHLYIQGENNFTIYQSTQGKNTFIENVYSIDPEAFPENGISNNYWYKKKINTFMLIIDLFFNY